MIKYKRLTLTATKATYKILTLGGQGIIEIDLLSKKITCTNFEPYLEEMKNVDFSDEIEEAIYKANKEIIEANYPEIAIYATH